MSILPRLHEGVDQALTELDKLELTEDECKCNNFHTDCPQEKYVRCLCCGKLTDALIDNRNIPYEAHKSSAQSKDKEIR